MEESQKLIIIKYNKSLQKILNISIANYKHFTGRYIIYDSVGKGREYNGNNDKLKFEGEYLNGERNGKGKEYYFDGKIAYEGEYLNGEKNGKGKEYNYKGMLIYEGDYLYDSYLKGKYYINEKLEYEG